MGRFLYSGIVGFLLLYGVCCFSEDSSLVRRVSTDALVVDARKVLAEAKEDNVAAAKKVDRVFEAARRLAEDGLDKQSLALYEGGLQLSPWSLQEQLESARIFEHLGDKKRAASIAKLVYETTETTVLLEDSRKMLGLTQRHDISALPNKNFDKKVICLIKVGNVDDWIIQKIGNRLHDTLGVDVYYYTQSVVLPLATRSYYQRWAEKLKDDINWDHPRVQLWMKEIGIEDRKASTVDQTLELLARINILQGQPDSRSQFVAIKEQLMARDQQWDAGLLIETMLAHSPVPDNVIPIAITNADLYSGDSNFVFGIANIGGNNAIVSTRRFTAEFNGERESQRRFFDRMHKQLLSSIGFALDIPRPSDPRSARSYPNGLADHDLKGAWLSPQCIEGFEKALGHKLPQNTYNETRKNL